MFNRKTSLRRFEDINIINIPEEKIDSAPPKSETKHSLFTVLISIAAMVVAVYAFPVVIVPALGGHSIDSFITKSETYKARKLPSGASFLISSLEQDKYKQYTLCDLYAVIDDENGVNYWDTQPLDGIKVDMEYVAKIVINYAKQRKWDNNYHLVIKYWTPQVAFYYDYETDEFYYSDSYIKYKKMYASFGKTEAKDLIGDAAGEKFLIAEGLAERKHDQVDLINQSYYSVGYIYNGEFSQDLENFIKY